MRASVSTPIFVSLSQRTSSMPTRHRCDALSTAVITSGENAGGVSTITKS